MIDTTKKPHIGIIIGSNRPTRICPTIANWAAKYLQDNQLDVDIIDLATVNLPFLDEPDIPANHHYQNDHTKAWSQLISRYDGFVLVFPQYNWGYPAVLKNALDYLYDEWSHKPVSLMSYGGHGGFQAALAMKFVTQGLHMYSMATNLSLDTDDAMFDETGQFKDIETDFKRYNQPLDSLRAEFIDLLAKAS